MKQLINGEGCSDQGVWYKIDAGLRKGINFLGDDRLGKSEFRNAITQHAAKVVEGFKYSHLYARMSEIASATQAGWTGTDHGSSQGSLAWSCLAFGFGSSKRIGDITFECPDVDRFTFSVQNTGAFALIFLGANTPANPRQGVISLNQPTSANRITGFDQLDELRNFDRNRATFNAERFAALQAPFSFDQGLLSGETKRDFLEVTDAFVGR